MMLKCLQNLIFLLISSPLLQAKKGYVKLNLNSLGFYVGSCVKEWDIERRVYVVVCRKLNTSREVSIQGT